MDSAMKRLSALVCVALLLGGCADPPLSPNEKRASLSAQGSLTAPSNLTATAVSPSQVDLAWRDKSSSETGFEVQRSTAGPSGTFAPLTETGANVTTYSNTGLSPSTQYCYKVRAIGGTSNKPKYSAFSNTSCATPAPPPAAPSGLSAITVSSTQIDLSWTDNAGDETGFNVERCQGADCTGFVEVAQVAANATAWVNSGLMANTTYRYRVRARKGTVFSEYSPAATATTMPPPPPPELTVVARTMGVDLDAGGYALHVLDASGVWRSVNLSTNGNVTLSDLRIGQVTLTLTAEAPNCYLTSPGSQVIDYNVSTTVTFDITCGRATPIAYASTADGNAEIYTISSTGTGNATRLTFHPGSDVEPAWSPDGARIAFRSDRSGNEEIYIMNADGSNPVRLTSDPAHDGSPAWSPDGAQIAFTSNRDGDQKTYVMSSTGSGDPIPTNQFGTDPAWSPDGQRIAFSRGPIHVMNADGTGVTRLTNPFNNGIPGQMYEYDSNPAWSPDGLRIMYTRTSCDGFGYGCIVQLMVVNADGPPEEWVTWGGEPAWSPEGRKIVFVNVDSIVVARADVSDGVSLTAGFNPAWGP